jgi:hypothetical protein
MKRSEAVTEFPYPLLFRGAPARNPVEMRGCTS